MGKINEIKLLFNTVDLIRDKHRKHDNYNLFKVLRSESDEVKLHSRFIHDLLDPLGSHCLSYVPIKQFIELCLSDVLPLKMNYIQVLREYKNIDILIKGYKREFAIIIENKIFAEDQDQQLSRYYELIKKESYKKIYIIYLTPTGHYASKRSISGLPSEIKNKIYNVSYKNEIHTWINSLIEQAVFLPSLRESLAQYKEIIYNITGENMDKSLINDVKKILLASGNIHNVSYITQALEEIKIDSQLRFWTALKDKMRKELEGEPTADCFLFSEHPRGKIAGYLNRTPSMGYLSIQIPIIGFDGITLSVSAEYDENIFYGIFTKQINDARILDVPDSYLDDNNHWPIYKYLDRNGGFNFRNLNPSQILLLNDEQYVDEITEEIVRDLKLFKQNIILS